MNIAILEQVAEFFARFRVINYCGRVGDNVIKLTLDSANFYVDLSKGKSCIFCDERAESSAKIYNAPFDFALKKYLIKARILACKVDGNNRILRLKCAKNLQYKVLESTLQMEFTGKYTNAIILNENEVVLEALRKITQNARVVQNGVFLQPLPQQESVVRRAFDGDILEFLKQQKNNENLENAKKTATQNLAQKIKKLIFLKDNLPPKNELEKRAKDYAKIGELLAINPNAEITNNSISLKDYEGKKLIFFVDNDINLHKNLINEFFTKSKKLKAKAQNIALQSQNLTENIAFLEAKIAIIKSAKNLSDIKIITHKQPRQAKHSRAKPQKYESFFIAQHKISIGKNERENIALLRDARADDVWMHIRNIPSSHLIIHSGKNTQLKDEILRKAGEILLGFAKLQGGNFLVDYTKRKFVKIKDGASVVYSNFSTLTLKTEAKMAISQIGNIAHINQNTLSNAQLQASQQNAQNAQNLINIQEFSQKIQENLEVRKTEESKAINKDGKGGGDANSAESSAQNAQSHAQKKQHKNIYGDDGILDIKV
ncbi:NFACT family protein [Helicobacter sp. 23-1044]